MYALICKDPVMVWSLITPHVDSVPVRPFREDPQVATPPQTAVVDGAVAAPHHRVRRPLLQVKALFVDEPIGSGHSMGINTQHLDSRVELSVILRPEHVRHLLAHWVPYVVEEDAGEVVRRVVPVRGDDDVLRRAPSRSGGHQHG